MTQITGCIIRVFTGDKNVCNALAHEFGKEYTVEVIGPTYGSMGLFCFRMERMGNLDLEGWMHSFAGDLEDMRTDGMLPNFGNSLRVNFELIVKG
jgi:hypothetical protein